MIQKDEAPSPPAYPGEPHCVKCGTTYSSKVEFVQHLLLHIERTYPLVTLNRADVENYHHRNELNMSSEGEPDINQTEQVETKPQFNNFESKTDVSSNNEIGDDDNMSICSSQGAPKVEAAPKMTDEEEIHTDAEANGRRSESSSGRDQSGAEDEDDGKTSEGSKSPAKPTTPSLPFAITVRKSEDLMAQTNYDLIQNRLEELYKRCQGKTRQGNRSTDSSLGKAKAGDSDPNHQLERGQTVRATQVQQASGAQNPPGHTRGRSPITTEGVPEDQYDATQKLSEAAPLSPAINDEIDAVLKGINFNRLPSEVDGVDSDCDMGLNISPTDCDWIEDTSNNPPSPDTPKNKFEDVPSPPPAPKPKKIGPKPKISDYFTTTSKSVRNSNSGTNIAEIPKQPETITAGVRSSKEKCNEVDDFDDRTFSGDKSCGNTKMGSSRGTVQKAVTPEKRYSTFKGVLDERGFDERGSHQNETIWSAPEQVTAGSARNGIPFRKRSSTESDLRESKAPGSTVISKECEADLSKGFSFERNERKQSKNHKGLKAIMTERVSSDRRTSMGLNADEQLKPVLTDSTVRAGGSLDAPGVCRARPHFAETQGNLLTSQNRDSSKDKCFKDEQMLEEMYRSKCTDNGGKVSQVDSRCVQITSNRVTSSSGNKHSSKQEIINQLPTHQNKISDRDQTDKSKQCYKGDSGNSPSSDSHDPEDQINNPAGPRRHSSALKTRDDANYEQDLSQEKVNMSDEHKGNKGRTNSGRRFSTKSSADVSNDLKPKASNSNPADGVQLDGTTLGARYGVDMRKFGSGLSLSVVQSGKKRPIGSQESGKDCSRFESDKNQKFGSDSGRRFSAKSSADVSDYLKPNASSSDPADGVQLNSTTVDARYGVDMRKFGCGLSVSVVPSVKKPHSSSLESGKDCSGFQSDEKTDAAQSCKGVKTVHTLQPSIAADVKVKSKEQYKVQSGKKRLSSSQESGRDCSRFESDEKTDTAQSSKGVKNVHTLQPSIAGDAKGRSKKVKKQSSSDVIDESCVSKDKSHGLDRRNFAKKVPPPSPSQNVDNQTNQVPHTNNPLSRKNVESERIISGKTEWNVDASMDEYDQARQDMSRQVHEILDMVASSKDQPLTEKEIDDLIAAVAKNQTETAVVEGTAPNPTKDWTDQKPKNEETDLVSMQGHKKSSQGKCPSLQSDNSKVNYQRGGVGKPRNLKTRNKNGGEKSSQLRPSSDHEKSLFEAQPVSDSSGDDESPPINSADLDNSGSDKSKASDSSMQDIQMPVLPPFFQEFPSTPAATLGIKMTKIDSQNGGGLPGERQTGNAPIKSTPGSSAVTPKACSSAIAPAPSKLQCPPVSPTSDPGKRFAVPVQRPNKDVEWRTRERRMRRRVAMRRKKISLKLTKHSPSDTTKSKKKSLRILSDSDSSGSFELKTIPKPVKEVEKPPDYVDELFTGLSPPKPLVPVSVSTDATFSPEKSYTNLQTLDRSFYQDPSVNIENPSLPFPSQVSLVTAVKKNFANGDFHTPQKDLYRCALCPRSFDTAAELDAHAVAEGHIICSMSEACASLSFDSQAALSHHQAMVHQSPAQTTAVQRLVDQVERLPQTFSGYPPQVPPQNFGAPPPYNLPQTSFNGPKLGSQVVLTPMPATVVAPPPQPSAPNLPNLPGIQVTKRPAPPPVDSSPNKLTRSEDGMPSIRLPDSITLVKSQPAAPPQNAVANMLAERGITMVASGSRAVPTQAASIQPAAPAKRLPNVPSAISIVPSRAQTSPQGQRFAVPPAPPQQRGRHMTNLGTVDLTRDDQQNGRMRGPGRPLGLPNRRLTCTICDKPFTTAESLQAHMAVHTSNKQGGRYMCEICRFVYPNEAKLLNHKKTVHPSRAASEEKEMVIPICDVNQPGVKEKLLQCGIRHVVQVANIRNASDTAVFGLPIISIDIARNEAYSRLDDLGASNILSLGNLRNIYHL